MPKIEETPYSGFEARTKRLGLGGLVDEVRDVLSDFKLELLEERDSNGGAVLREIIDARFEAKGGWKKNVAGDVDWLKCKVVNGTSVCLGVEVQVSARSDLIARDVHHLRDAVDDGRIDIAILVVPSDKTSVFLTDRGPFLSDAKKHIKGARATDLPLLLISLSHDGPGPALAKRYKRKGPKSS